MTVVSVAVKMLANISVLLACAAHTLAQGATPPPAPPQIEFEERGLFAKHAISDEYVIKFPSSVASESPANEIVPLHLLIPRNVEQPMPVVLILHYWGALDRNIERQIALELNKRGIAAALMTLPYHLDRTPHGTRSGDLAIQADVGKLLQTTEQSLQDSRRSIDYIYSRPEFDQTRVGVAGLSLGAIVAALVYGVDDRLSRGAFILGGVDVAHIIWNSSRVAPQREALRRKGITEEKLRELFAPLEPEALLKTRKNGPSLVIAARFDTVIPARSTRSLIEALDQPEVLWMETGHYGGFFVQKRLLGQAAEFFETEFAGGKYDAPASLGAPTLRLGVQYDVSSGLDIGFGADLWSAGKNREIALTGFLTPRGARLFLGHRLDRAVSIGVSYGFQGAGFGLMWSTVL